MLQRYKFFSKYYSDIPKIHHDLLAVYDIDTLHGRGQARDSVPLTFASDYRDCSIFMK
jgi:hypothetical protein